MIRHHFSRAILACSLLLFSVNAEKPPKSLRWSTHWHWLNKQKLIWYQINQTELAEDPKLPASMTLETIFGTVEVTDAVVIELLHHPAMTRLKGVDQHGPPTYWMGTPTFDRYTHSVGVYVLLKKFGAPLVEQIAGLLHDASHTIFSHLADRLFKTGNQLAYQDRIHEWT